MKHIATIGFGILGIIVAIQCYRGWELYKERSAKNILPDDKDSSSAEFCNDLRLEPENLAFLKEGSIVTLAVNDCSKSPDADQKGPYITCDLLKIEDAYSKSGKRVKRIYIRGKKDEILRLTNEKWYLTGTLSNIQLPEIALISGSSCFQKESVAPIEYMFREPIYQKKHEERENKKIKENESKQQEDPENIKENQSATDSSKKIPISATGGKPNPGSVRLSDYLLPSSDIMVILTEIGGDMLQIYSYEHKDNGAAVNLTVKSKSCASTVMYMVHDDQLLSKLVDADGECSPPGDYGSPIFVRKGDKLHIQGKDTEPYEVTSTKAKVTSRFRIAKSVEMLDEAKITSKTLDCLTLESQPVQLLGKNTVFTRTYCKGYGLINMSNKSPTMGFDIAGVVDPKS